MAMLNNQRVYGLVESLTMEFPEKQKKTTILG